MFECEDITCSVCHVIFKACRNKSGKFLPFLEIFLCGGNKLKSKIIIGFE